MIKAVLDTNVIISGVMIESGNPGKIIELWKKKKFVLVTSEEIIEEIIRVLAYPKVREKYKITDEKIRNLIRDIRKKAQIVEGVYTVEKVKDDLTDNKFLACGLEGKVDYIISGDYHLRSIKFYQKIPIVSAAYFLKLLMQPEQLYPVNKNQKGYY